MPAEPGRARYFVLQGDAVDIVDTRAALLARIGTADSVEESRILAASEGYKVLCGPGTARKTDDGFEIFAKKPGTGCASRFDGVVLGVGPAGEVRIKRTVPLESPNQPCVPERD